MKSVDELGSSLFEEMRQVTMYYLTQRYKHNMSWSSDCFIFELRESIWFRIMGLQWHCRELEKNHKLAEDNYFDAIQSDDLHTLILNNQRIQYILFDDIIYNLLSLFEYVGNLVGFFWKEEHGKSKKWKGISGAAMDKSNPLSEEAIASVIDKAHRKLVTHLEEYRAKVFHYEFHEVHDFNSGLKVDYFSVDGKIEVKMSESFKKALKHFDITCDDKSEVLVYSERVVIESFKVVDEIFEHLLKWKVEAVPFKF